MKKEKCYIVLCSDYAEGQDVYAFSEKSDAVKNILEDAETTLRNLITMGYKPCLLNHDEGHITVYVPDSDIYSEFQIFESDITCPEDYFDSARANELNFICDFSRTTCFDCDICKDQFRALWTAYCMRNNLDVDTATYDFDIRRVWEVVAETDTADWSDFDSFDLFMGAYLC